MKKFLAVGLTAALAASMCFSFAACDVSGNEENKGDGSVENEVAITTLEDAKNFVSEKITEEDFLKAGSEENFDNCKLYYLEVHYGDKRLIENVRANDKIYYSEIDSNIDDTGREIEIEYNFSGYCVENKERNVITNYAKDIEGGWFKETINGCFDGDFMYNPYYTVESCFQVEFEELKYDEEQKGYSYSGDYGTMVYKFKNKKLSVVYAIEDDAAYGMRAYTYGGQTVTLPKEIEDLE